MADERCTFEQARERLEEIVRQVRRKDVSLEQSLDMLEEGVRLANVCTELSDHTEWRSAVENGGFVDAGEVAVAGAGDAVAGTSDAVEEVSDTVAEASDAVTEVDDAK